MPKVVSIHSYRGGTGKSSFTANLATTVAMQGYRVGVVDTDIPSPGIHNLFCLEPEQINYSLNSFLWEESKIEDAAYDISTNIQLPGNGKIYFVPATVKADEIARILKDGYDVKLLNNGFRQLIKSLKLDYLFIDTHHGFSKETFLTIAVSHLLVIMLCPEKQDYQGTTITIDIARQLRAKNILLVINKALPTKNLSELQQEVEQAYNTTVAGIFPLCEDLFKFANEGVFCIKYPEHSITQEFKKVAKHIVQ